jgi:hypothetical protein
MKRPAFGRRLLTALTVLCLSPQAAFGWRAEGHIYVNRVAAQHIPSDMPRFLRRAVAELAYLGPEPDRWRNPSCFR